MVCIIAGPMRAAQQGFPYAGHGYVLPNPRAAMGSAAGASYAMSNIYIQNVATKELRTLVSVVPSTFGGDLPPSCAYVDISYTIDF